MGFQLLRNVIVRLRNSDLFLQQQSTLVSLSRNHYKTSNMSKNKKKGQQQETAAAAVADPLYNPNKAIYLQKTSGNNICVNFFAKPGANETSITDINEDAIGVRIAAPPVDGEANKELVKYISRLLKLKSGDVYLDTGAKNRNKTLILQNCTLSVDQIMEKFKSETTSS